MSGAVGTALEVIDLFAGAGGLSLGLEAAGLSVCAAVEHDSAACETYRANHPGAKVLEGDIAEVDFASIRGAFAVVAGGPPCQPFSVGGKRLAQDDARNGLPQFVRAVRELRPAAFVMENVPGLVHGLRAAYFAQVVSQLESLGYATSWAVLQAAHYGVPQLRQRLFLVGSRGRRPQLPLPTHGGPSGRPVRAAASALDPARPRGRPNRSLVTYARRPSLRPSPYHGQLFNGGGRPIDPGRPAPTLLASMGGNKTPWVDTLGLVPEYHAHLMAGGEPRQGVVAGARRISVEEAAALQTFPAGTVFEGPPSVQYRQVGNAVPPLLARAVGRSVLEVLAGRARVGAQSTAN